MKNEFKNYEFILASTQNKGFFKVPLSCIIQYQGFFCFCTADIPKNYLEVDRSLKHLFSNQIKKL